MGLADHALAVLLVAVLPCYGLVSVGALRRAVAAGRPGARARTYRRATVLQWALAAILVARWLSADRELADLGLAPAQGWIPVATLALVGLAAAGLVLQWSHVLESSRARAELRKELDSLGPILPREAGDRVPAMILAITAGFCEELLYRGFLLAWLAGWMSPWLALLPASLVFGLGHAYQGPAGILKTFVVGAVLGAIYLASGALWAPMLLHALVDLNAILLAWATRHDSGSFSGAVPAPEE